MNGEVVKERGGGADWRSLRIRGEVDWPSRFLRNTLCFGCAAGDLFWIFRGFTECAAVVMAAQQSVTGTGGVLPEQVPWAFEGVSGGGVAGGSGGRGG